MAPSEHLVPVEYTEVTKHMCFIVLPYELLSEWKPLNLVVKNEILSEAQISNTIRDVMTGLRHLRKSHICHGNVTMSNIILNTEIDRAMLTDYGSQREFFKFNAVPKSQKEQRGPIYTRIEKYVLACNIQDPSTNDYL